MARVTIHLMREIGTDEMVMINPYQIRFIRGCNNPQNCEIVFSETHSVIVWATLAEVTQKFGSVIGVRSGDDILGSSDGSFPNEVRS